MAKELKLYRLESDSADWDDLVSAVVFAETPEQALKLLISWHSGGGDVGNFSPPYEATEVEIKAGVVHLYVLWG